MLAIICEPIPVTVDECRGQYNSLMRPLRYLYALALVLWLGGWRSQGSSLHRRHSACSRAGTPRPAAFWRARFSVRCCDECISLAMRAAVVMLLTLTLQRMLGPRPKHYGIRVGLLAVMLGLMLYSGIILSPRIDQIQAQVTGPMNQLPATDEKRLEFDGLHQLSTILVTATMAGGLVLSGVGSSGVKGA